jgi:FkbM family methyltransferase
MPTALAEARRKAVKLLRLGGKRDYRAALRLGVAAAIEHEGAGFEYEAQSIIDVGANRGQFALFAIHRFPTAQLHCFEPVPVARNVLHKAVGERPAVRIHPLAIGSSAGQAVLHVSESDDSSSLLAPSPRLMSIYPQTREVQQLTVEVARLDEVLEVADLRSPCLLKIDVQGFEQEVLTGAEGLFPMIDEILVECSFVELYSGQPLADDLIGHLRGRGYRLRGIHDVVTDGAGTSLQADFRFTRVGPPVAG